MAAVLLLFPGVYTFSPTTQVRLHWQRCTRGAWGRSGWVRFTFHSWTTSKHRRRQSFGDVQTSVCTWGASGVRCAHLIRADGKARVWISSTLLPASVHRVGKEAPARQKQTSVLWDPASTAGAPISLMGLNARVTPATVDLPAQKTWTIVKRQIVGTGGPAWTGLMATRVSVHLSTAEHVASEYRLGSILIHLGVFCFQMFKYMFVYL